MKSTPVNLSSSVTTRKTTKVLLDKLIQRPLTEFRFAKIILLELDLYLIEVVRVQGYSAVPPRSRMARVFCTCRLLRAASMVSIIASRKLSCSSLRSVSLLLRSDVTKANESFSLCSRLMTEHVADGVQ
jgi:hypothetical protein